ncbi:hypothetical protein KKG31_05940 [Patescibacteria group bacterium]|nr:hypothetical protein [Patescibacteria group bacterium]
MVQRMPKLKGFKRPFKLVKDVTVINLGTLDQDKRISDTMEVSKAKLKEFGYIKNVSIVVKILGDGDYNKKLTFIDIDVFSKSAQAKLDKPGSTKTGKLKLKSIKDQNSEKVDKKIVKKAVKKVPVAKKVEKVAEKVAPVKKVPTKVVKKPTKVKEAPLLEVKVPKKPSTKKVTK